MAKGIYPLEKRKGLFIDGIKIKKVCLVCKKEYEVTPCNKNSKYCSIDCWKIRNPKKEFCCSKCKKIYHDYPYKEKIAKNHYCSEECRRSINPKKPRVCKFCNKTFYEWDGNINKITHKGHFCSKKCKNEYFTGERCYWWNGGSSFEPYTKEFNNIFKEFIKQRDNYACLKCGLSASDSKRLLKTGLQIHHIDYNKKITSKENCCSLCLRCNISVNKNKIYWTNFFYSLLAEKYGYQYSSSNKITGGVCGSS